MLNITAVSRLLKREADKLTVAFISSVASHRNLCVFHSQSVRLRGSMSNFEALSFISRQGCTNGHRSLHDYSVDADVPRGTTKADDSYEKAIVALNGLQTNASVVKESISRPHSFASLNLLKTEKYLVRSGISLEDLDKLSVIHVSGTKGKGSTCAITESILRAHGYKTGFYSSPHLVSATERIRLDGRPIATQTFAKYFWKVYTALLDKRDGVDDMPAYFKFLTLMAFHVFIGEKVDCAIVEVGIGGAFDCTNVLRTTKTVGITSLGLEHTNILGDTIEEIAWQKAGIIKPGSRVFTLPHPEVSLRVIKKQCLDKNADLVIVPDFIDYNWPAAVPKLGIDTNVHKINTSLAIQLSHDWMRNHGTTFTKSETRAQTTMNEATRIGVETCFWPGRCQLVTYKKMRFYLDGAHTSESIQVCMDWFMNATKSSKNAKFLVFNVTGYRDSAKMLRTLHDNVHFAEAIFVPNISSLHNNCADTVNLNMPIGDQLKRSQEHSRIWKSFPSSKDSPSRSVVLNCVVDVFDHLNKRRTELCADQEIDVLTTGSLHLIGATLLALEEVDKR